LGGKCLLFWHPCMCRCDCTRVLYSVYIAGHSNIHRWRGENVHACCFLFWLASFSSIYDLVNYYLQLLPSRTQCFSIRTNNPPLLLFLRGLKPKYRAFTLPVYAAHGTSVGGWRPVSSQCICRLKTNWMSLLLFYCRSFYVNKSYPCFAQVSRFNGTFFEMIQMRKGPLAE